MGETVHRTRDGGGTRGQLGLVVVYGGEREPDWQPFENDVLKFLEGCNDGGVGGVAEETTEWGERLSA